MPGGVQLKDRVWMPFVMQSFKGLLLLPHHTVLAFDAGPVFPFVWFLGAHGTTSIFGIHTGNDTFPLFK